MHDLMKGRGNNQGQIKSLIFITIYLLVYKEHKKTLNDKLNWNIVKKIK